ncbi:MAG: restriction endonuclease subunit S, partial [Nanoarchaeota archaeon]|nr:restriction endonuclease subunit S [Nanoarchaeota archaeon]
LKFDNLRYISKEYFEKTIKGKIKNYQILMNKDGAQTGKIAFVENFKFEKAMINEHVFIITSSEEFNNKFVFYYLLSHNGMKQVKSKIVGSAQGGLSNGFFKGILLPKPELPIQDKIADVLSLVDNNIEQTKKVIEKAEKLKKSMMQNLLTGRMKPDGTYRKNEELKETIVGEIPKSWKLIKAKDFCSFVTDGTHDTPKPTSAGFKLLTSKNLTGKGIDLSDSYFISEKDYTQVNKRSKVEKYDVLYGMIGTIGNPEIVLFDEVNFAIKNVGLFKMDKQEHKSFWLKCYLDSTAYSNYVRKMTAGTTQSFVGLGFLRKILIPTPFIDNKINMDEIINISSKLKVAELKLIESRNKLQSLEKLKKSLMQNLLTGKIEIPENLTIKQGVVA